LASLLCIILFRSAVACKLVYFARHALSTSPAMPDQSTASSSLARADKPAATAVRNAAARFATVSQLLRSASPSPLQAGLSRDADTSSGL